MIDLHTHTTASDGTYSPARLVETAAGLGLEALAITDHDGFAGYDEAAPVARLAGLDLVCGIELSARLPGDANRRGKSAHLLGYFLYEPPSQAFRQWLREIQEARRERNRRLVGRLNEIGVEITLEEVNEVGGYMTGRPHFARILLLKGYVASYQEAFDEYLDESAPGYVQRVEPAVAEGIQRIREGNGMVVAAHPVRLASRDPERQEQFIRAMQEDGLQGIEVYHTDHEPEDEQRFLDLARRLDLRITGGSDFHGDLKPHIKLGTGSGRLDIPRTLLDELRESVRV